jgi:Flp pilus assembly protein TadD
MELYKNKNWPALIEHCQRWIETHPKDRQAWYGLGIAYGQSGQLAKAVEACRQALRIDPKDAMSWNNLAIFFSLSGNQTAVLDAVQQLRRLNPDAFQEPLSKLVRDG